MTIPRSGPDDDGNCSCHGLLSKQSVPTSVFQKRAVSFMERDHSARPLSGEIEAGAVLMNRLIVPQFRTEPAHITTESTAAALIVLP
jgi:hypothetical protein